MADPLTTNSVRPVSEYNFLDPKVQDDPFEYYRALHEQAPVYYMPEMGIYMVSRYEDLKRLLLDTATFSNRLDARFLQGDNYHFYEDAIVEGGGWLDIHTLNSADPPEHTRYRRIGDKIFSARRIEGIVPRVNEIVNTIMDRFIDRGECEFVTEFAFPVVGTVISEQLGLDSRDMATFKKWGDAIMAPAKGVLTPDELREAGETIVEMQKFVARKLEERRKDPKDDLISALVQAGGEEEQPLDMAELQSLMRQFLSGTYESLVSEISHGMWLLLRFPGQMAKLRADPDLVPAFIEELLRFESAVPGLARLVTKDTEIAGVHIPKGAIVMTRYAAANHDASKFPCPHLFDIDRADKSHLSFGMGVHMCIGRVLARREMNSAFTNILRRMDNIQLARPLPDEVHVPHVMLRPMKELYIKFDKIS